MTIKYSNGYPDPNSEPYAFPEWDITMVFFLCFRKLLNLTGLALQGNI